MASLCSDIHVLVYFQMIDARRLEKDRPGKVFMNSLAGAGAGITIDTKTLKVTYFLPPTNEVCEGCVFTPVCQSFCSQGTRCLGPGTGGRLGSGQGGLQVHNRGGGWGSGQGGFPDPHPGGGWGSGRGGLQVHTQGGGGWVWVWVWPGTMPRPTSRGVQAHTQGGPGPGPWGWIPTCTEAHTPLHSRLLLLRAVRILLECILVKNNSTKY